MNAQGVGAMNTRLIGNWLVVSVTAFMLIP